VDFGDNAPPRGSTRAVSNAGYSSALIRPLVIIPKDACRITQNSTDPNTFDITIK